MSAGALQKLRCSRRCNAAIPHLFWILFAALDQPTPGAPDSTPWVCICKACSATLFAFSFVFVNKSLAGQVQGPQQLALHEQIRRFSTPHWQNVQVCGDGEPESTIIKSEDSHTFTIRCPNKHETKNEGACSCFSLLRSCSPPRSAHRRSKMVLCRRYTHCALSWCNCEWQPGCPD